MNLIDTNIWLALVLSTHTFHDVVSRWFAAITRPRSILACRSTEQSFLRLLTTEKILRHYGVPPMTNDAAWRLYRDFRADARIAYATEPEGIEPIWERFATRATASPKMWMDAYLAAFAVAGGHTLVTTDGDFRHYKKLNSVILVASKR